MIRPATLDDIPAIMEMGKAFADEAGVTERVGWDHNSVESLLEGILGSPDGILLVGDRSFIGGVVAPHPFNQHHRVFMEFFWRSHGREGLKLLKEAERLAKKRGAHGSIMIGMADMPDLERFYGRIGYRPVEAQYYKEL